MIQIGRYEIYSIETGRFRLDGGSMFGVVPKALWQKAAPCDEQNRIFLSMRTLVALDRRGGRVILVDTGAGEKWSDAEIDRFAFEISGDRLGAGLRALSLRDEDVTDVLVTHLHFDHNAGLTRWVDPAEQRAAPRFPIARHWLHQRHWDYAQHPTEKDRASFLPRDYDSVFAAGLFTFLDGDEPASPFDDIRLFVANGHTSCQMLPWFHDGEREMLYVADMIPTFAHLPVPWVMAFDNFPLQTIEEKKLVYAACRERGLWIASEHDPNFAGAKIAFDGRRPVVAEPLDL